MVPAKHYRGDVLPLHVVNMCILDPHTYHSECAVPATHPEDTGGLPAARWQSYHIHQDHLVNTDKKNEVGRNSH